MSQATTDSRDHGLPNLAKPPRLSIALVTRNRPAYLERCLRSWRSQAVQPFEIVVSDDSDADVAPESERLAREFDCVYIAGPKRGLYANRNHAFCHCRGSHVMSADDDHTHPPDFVASIIACIQQDPQAVWTVGERPGGRPEAPIGIPSELRRNGTIGPPEDPAHSAAIACGSTVYPRAVFDRGLRCDETYFFGGLWHLWGHQLRRAGFRIRHCAATFVWHHTESSDGRLNDAQWAAAQIECGLYVQAVHALHLSRSPVALLRVGYSAMRLWMFGGGIYGRDITVRLSSRAITRALGRAWHKRLTNPV